jgi:activator of HSP90 ATPase
MRLYGGAIEMDNIEEDSEKMVIKMNFKEKTWSSSSQVTISFKDDDSENTTLRLEQSNVPSGNAPQMKQ